jgi:WD40 repeat protein
MTGKLSFSLIVLAWLSAAGASQQTRGVPHLVLQTGHGSPVNQLTFSSNGHLLGSHSSDGTTKVWDVAAGSIVWSFDQKGGGPGIAPSEEFAPISISEAQLLSGNELGYVDEISMQTGTVSGRLIPSTNASSDPKNSYQGPPIVALAQSDDGKWRVVCNGAGRVAAFETGKAAPLIVQSSGAPATNLWFDSRSHRLLVRFEDKSTLFQDLDGGEGVRLPQLNLEQDASVAFSPSGDLLILQTMDKGFLLTTFSEHDLSRKAKAGEQGIDPSNVRQVSCACAQVLLSADGTKLATFEGDSTAYRNVRVWTASRLKKVAEFTPPPQFMLAALSKDGSEVAFGGFDGSVSIASVPRDEFAEPLSRAVRSPVSLQWLAGGELAVIDGGGAIESWNPARGSSSLAFQSGPVAYPAISANGKFIAARTAADEFVIENVDDHKFESLGFKVNGRVASLSVSDAGDALLWSSGDLAHLDIDQAIKRTESLASNLDNPGAKSDTLGPLISLPLDLAKRTPQGWTNEELCRSKNNVPWGLFTSSHVITAGCSPQSGQEHPVAGAEIQAMAQVPQVTVLTGSRFLRVMTSRDTFDIKSGVFDPVSVAISPDGHWVSILGSNSVQIVELSTREPHAVWQPEEPIQASSIATSNKAPQVAIANNGTVYFVDGSGVVQGYSAEGKRLFNMISLADQGWIVLDTSGRFDTSDVEEAGSAVKWRVADDPSHPLPVEIFMRDYFAPKLLPKLLGEGPLPEVLPLAKLNRAQPEVRIVSVSKENDPSETVAVRVAVKSRPSTIQKDSQGRYLTSGVYDVRLFRNEQIVGDWPKANAVEKPGPIMTDEDRASWRKSHEVELDTAGNATITFRHVQLPKGAGVNKVAFTAYSHLTLTVGIGMRYVER